MRYRCQECEVKPAPSKELYGGLKEYDLVAMEEMECPKCENIMPIVELVFSDCFYSIKGNGEKKVKIQNKDATARNEVYKLPSLSWSYLEFKAWKPNI